MRGKLLKQFYSKKTLGVLIDDNLWRNEQIDNISKKVSKGIGMLRRAKPFVSIETLTYIYQVLVQPSFDYCSMVWGNCGEGSKEKLQRLQNRAARVITGDTYEIRTRLLSTLWKAATGDFSRQILKRILTNQIYCSIDQSKLVFHNNTWLQSH